MACSESDTKSGKLLIRRNLADTGARPISPDPCTDYWSSPDIWLEGGIDNTTAKVGVPNTVKVRVKNLSNQEIDDVNVQAWVCDYTLGVGPASSILSANPDGQPMTGFEDVIIAGDNKVISCGTWTPVATDATLNDGHVCLIANCYSEVNPKDGAPIPPSTFKWCCDSHHAQRNIAVRSVPGGGGRMMRMDFRMFVANPEEKKEEPERGELFTVAIREITRPDALGPDEREFIASGPYANLPVQPSTTKVRDFGVGSKGCLNLLRFRGMKETKLTLPPGKRMPIVIQATFDPNEQIGNVHTFEIIQTNTKGEIIGGATLLAIITS